MKVNSKRRPCPGSQTNQFSPATQTFCCEECRHTWEGPEKENAFSKDPDCPRCTEIKALIKDDKITNWILDCIKTQVGKLKSELAELKSELADHKMTERAHEHDYMD